MFANQTPETQNKLVDQASASADQAIRSTQRVANEALNGLAGSAQSLREQAAPVVDRIAERASALAHHGVDAVRERSHQLSDSAHRVADGTRSYVNEQPVKSLLIAAATGAALMGLLAFLARSRRQS
jgi:ElaB/YqjD/DUF883 family membrane-anchored ribosome-binding protein